MNDDLIQNHKKMAMGNLPAFKAGGSVPYLKSGKPDTPLEMAKRKNGIPGFKHGGAVKAK